MRTLCFLLILGFRKSCGHYEQPATPEEQIVGPYGETRRILRGTSITDTRPYMVYLRAATAAQGTRKMDPDWLCGGVIIHPRYILTSAACIEDVVNFYVVSGTHQWVPASETNDCIKNGATRAIWKCVPKTYRYDGDAFNNIHWMVNDIAVVMVENEFNFERRVRGCDFVPKSIAYNNVSLDNEKPGTKGTIAGWGSTERFKEVARTSEAAINSPNLMEAEVVVVPKKTCKNLWLERYHKIIDEYMICGKNIPVNPMDEVCDGETQCRQLVFSEEDLEMGRRGNKISDRHLLRSLAQLKKARRMRKSASRRGVIGGTKYGGFCENDHGGPLIAGRGTGALVVGIISAFRNANHSKDCVGPFLYTSVWNNRFLIDCAVYKDLRQRHASCRAVLRSSSTVLDQEHLDWRGQERNPGRNGPEEYNEHGEYNEHIERKEHKKHHKKRKVLRSVTADTTIAHKHRRKHKVGRRPNSR